MTTQKEFLDNSINLVDPKFTLANIVKNEGKLGEIINADIICEGKPLTSFVFEWTHFMREEGNSYDTVFGEAVASTPDFLPDGLTLEQTRSLIKDRILAYVFSAFGILNMAVQTTFKEGSVN